MRRMFAAVGFGLALAVISTIGSAAADKLEISQKVYESYQEYLKQISGFSVAVFAVSKNGANSQYVYCSENCSLSRLSKQAVDECEQHAKQPCEVMAVNHDLRIEFDVYTPTAAVTSGDQILANRIGAQDLQRRIVGNTIRGEYPNHVKWSEFYDPNGDIRGHDEKDGDYTARYTLEGDQICYDYPPNYDDWCGQVSDVGNQIYFLKDGELVTYIRNASIVPGNPDNL